MVQTISPVTAARFGSSRTWTSNPIPAGTNIHARATRCSWPVIPRGRRGTWCTPTTSDGRVWTRSATSCARSLRGAATFESRIAEAAASRRLQGSRLSL